MTKRTLRQKLTLLLMLCVFVSVPVFVTGCIVDDRDRHHDDHHDVDHHDVDHHDDDHHEDDNHLDPHGPPAGDYH